MTSDHGKKSKDSHGRIIAYMANPDARASLTYLSIMELRARAQIGPHKSEITGQSFDSDRFAKAESNRLAVYFCHFGQAPKPLSTLQPR